MQQFCYAVPITAHHISQIMKYIKAISICTWRQISNRELERMPPCCHVIRAQNIFGASQKVCLPGSTFSHLEGCCSCSSLLIQWSESVAIFITRVFVFGSKLTLTSVCRVHRRRVQIFETTSTYISKFVIRKVHTNSGAVFPKSFKSSSFLANPEKNCFNFLSPCF